MRLQTRLLCLLAGIAATIGSVAAVTAQEQQQTRRPEVAGAWAGTWELYTPPAPGTQPKKAPVPPMGLEAKVEQLPEGKWQATFEGDCGRPYKYTIKMQGREAGGVVLFQGTADLGPRDGGVYDWIGRASEKEFIGFYTSQGHTGTFRLARPKPSASNSLPKPPRVRVTSGAFRLTRLPPAASFQERQHSASSALCTARAHGRTAQQPFPA